MAPDHSREPDFPTGIGRPAARALAVAGYTRLEQLTTVTLLRQQLRPRCCNDKRREP
jgi:hypothetical protein